jgi:hypothetical protein
MARRYPRHLAHVTPGTVRRARHRAARRRPRPPQAQFRAAGDG